MPSTRYALVKRACDILGSGLGIVVTAPVQAVVALAIRRQMGSPVLFRQWRPGRDGAPFELVKFRTMRAPQAGEGLDADGARMTPLGGFLRRTSLDELPTLWNVFTGDMSLVGPRPLLMSYLERYTPEQARRHEVRPGLTGLAQVRGRNLLDWDERFAADVEYVDHRGFCLDSKVLMASVRLVLSRKGVSAPGSATMPEFQRNS